MVTHNIEEAVLMCDRVLVFSSNPGRVAHELRVPFPHPRNRLDPAFRQMVDDIYAVMTRRAPALTPTAHAKAVEIPFATALHPVSTNLLAGLLETLAAPPYEGRADLPALAASLQLEADELLPLGEVLQLLRLGELADGDLRLTELGRQFAEADTDTRKSIFAGGADLACAADHRHPALARRALESPRLGGALSRGAGGPHVAGIRRGDAADRDLLGPLRRIVQLRRGSGTVQPGGHRHRRLNG